jgi:hypothetical protein
VAEFTANVYAAAVKSLPAGVTAEGCGLTPLDQLKLVDECTQTLVSVSDKALTARRAGILSGAWGSRLVVVVLGLAGMTRGW